MAELQNREPSTYVLLGCMRAFFMLFPGEGWTHVTEIQHVIHIFLFYFKQGG